jgi:hypothetical protein
MRENERACHQGPLNAKSAIALLIYVSLGLLHDVVDALGSFRRFFANDQLLASTYLFLNNRLFVNLANFDRALASHTLCSACCRSPLHNGSLIPQFQV